MMRRNTLSLDGIWRFLPDPHADGESLGFWRSSHPLRTWGETRVPSCFDAACPSLDRYTGQGWYRRTFRLTPAWQGRRVVLRFEAVNYRARVWLNGRFLGEHADGFLPFEFDVQDCVHHAGENDLTVMADNSHHEGDVPGMHVQWRGFGGILRSVFLYDTDALHLERLEVNAYPQGEGGAVECRAVVRNLRTSTVEGVVEVAVRDPDGRVVLVLGPAPRTLLAGERAEVTLTGELAGARCWSPSAPVLYRAEACLRDPASATDALDTTFGFRRVEATRAGLRLNGVPLFLTGFNRHEDSPRRAMAEDLETARQDFRRMKDAGANFVRLCHYPHSAAELNLCDEIGLLAMCEIPLNLVIDPGRAATARRQMTTLIRRDFNHPSVIFWSVGNETNDQDAEAAQANRDLIRAARAQDPTRLCVHVSHRWKDAPNFEEDDVICINYYPSIAWTGRRGSAPDADLGESVEKWRCHLDSLRQRHPGKPILITEFGYSSFAGTRGHAFGEDQHARVIEAESAVMDMPQICGAVIWCWADHPWPPPGLFGGLAVSPFGVLTRNRQPKEPFRTVRRLFRSKRGSVMAPEPDRMPGPWIRMVRPTLDGIPEAAFPEGFGIRTMARGDVGLWTDIQRDAEPYLEIRDSLFDEEFGCDNPAIEWRCFIMTGPRGLGVGTISAWYDRDFQGEDAGRIHWVAVRPACQRRGIARAALAHALHVMAAWHRRCYLVTSTQRLGAVRLYLDFGFQPDLTPPDARPKWCALAAGLDHPVLRHLLADERR